MINGFSHPSHDHKAFALLVRQDLMMDLAHIDPQAVTFLSKGYGVAQRLHDPADTDEKDGMWKPLRDHLDRHLLLSRAKHGLRSNQVTDALRGADRDGPRDTEASKHYNQESTIWQ